MKQKINIAKRNSFKKSFVILFAFVLLFSCKEKKKDNLYADANIIVKKESAVALNKIVKTATAQYTDMLNVAKDSTQYPRTLEADGKLKTVSIDNWTGGFWAGSLWYLYEFTNDKKWSNQAEKWTKTLENNQFNTKHHDLGFMMYNSYGNAFRITKDASYIPVIIQSAKSLISRYSPKVKSIESWDDRTSMDGKELWTYPVIIDNMMNLELLFFASAYTKDTIYKHVALQHAETSMKHHIRKDFSSYHMVNYDEETGEPLNKEAVQGFSDNSTWARGQAWAVYGFTSVYKETRDKKYLELAQNLADFYLDNKRLPADKIPYWDFNVGEKGYNPDWNFIPNEFNPVPRDASAAAIMASALLELSRFSNFTLNAKYRNAAEKMLISLSSDNYSVAPNANNHFLLNHSVGNMQKKSEVDVPIVYADYYYLEALLKYKKLTSNLN